MKTADYIVDAPARFLPAGTPFDSDAHLLDQVESGSEAAFSELVSRYHAAMIRLARSYVSSTLAEEAVQETWIAVLKGLQRFERRSTFKTWLFRVLINHALTLAAREARGGRGATGQQTDETLIESWHFYADDHSRAGQWLVPPRVWTPEEKILSNETLERIEREIEKLPVLQRQVIALRDVEGWTSREVCDLLTITEINQRVLLHRARTRLRSALAEFFYREKP
jgi:RNA polymerase sigma-70 factor (ECF subfamily)